MQQRGAFRLIERAGVGGMGEVWRAVHEPTGHPAAVKLLLRRSRSLVQAFRTEVRAVAALAHPNVVRVLDTGVAEDGPWLAMEWADGGTLTPPTSWQGLADVLADLLRGLAHAHAHGVRHLDVKPANVLRCGEQWKLADFGIARLEDHARRQTVARGTPTYMAPEQFRGRDHGPATDLFAVGRLAETLARQAQLSCPSDLPDWLAWLQSPDSAERPPLAADALAALLDLGTPTRRLADEVTPNPLATLDFFDDPLPEAAAPARAKRRFETPAMPTGWPATPTPPPPLPGTGLGVFAIRPVPLVDRAEERATLWEAMTRARSGKAVVLLEGPSGRGKTRLARELGRLAAEHGAAHVLSLRHGQGGGLATGLGPALARALGVVGLSPDDALPVAQDLVADLGDAATLIDEALNGGGRRSRRQRHAAVARFLARADRPWLILVDDAQWADEALALVDELPNELPVLAVLTVRSDALDPAVGARVDALEPTRLRLQPLPESDHRDLVAGLLGLAGPVVDQVHARTAGNPLFAVQLVGDWVQRGLLQTEHGGFRLSEDQPPLPTSLKVVWNERIDRLLSGLPEPSKEHLQLAALLGQQVDAREWEAACGRPDAPLLDRLMGAQLAEPLDHGWAFAHGMLRETLLELDGARALHERCAEAVRGDGADSHERRARHFEEAGRPLRAIPHRIAAAYQHERRGAPDQAFACLDQVIALADELGLPPDHDLRIEQSGARMGVSKTAGRTLEAVAQAKAFLDLAPAEHPVRARAHVVLGDTALSALRAAEALDHFERARGFAEQGGRHWASITQSVSSCHLVLGDLDRSEAELRRALDCGVEDPILRVDCTRAWARIHLRRSDLEGAARLFQQAADFAGEGHLRLGQALACTELGGVRHQQGRIDEALAAFDVAEERFSIYGRGWLDALDGGRCATVLERDPVAAREMATRALPSLLERGRREGGPALLVRVLTSPDVASARADLDRYATNAQAWKAARDAVAPLLERCAELPWAEVAEAARGLRAELDAP